MNAYAANAVQATSTYQREALLNLTPVQVIKKLYDITIVSLKKNEARTAQRALNELIAGLNFDAGDLPVRLYELYDYCKRCIRSGDFEGALAVLEELRTAWSEAFNV